LEDNAIPFRQLDQPGKLLLGSWGIEVKGHPDVTETDRGFFRDSQCAPEIQIPLGYDTEIVKPDSNGCCHSLQRDTRAADQSLK
jgi:hypothetical protein